MILILHRCQLLEVARGLTYLHWYDLVHGNLTGVSLNNLVRRLGTDDLIAQYPRG